MSAAKLTSCAAVAAAAAASMSTRSDRAYSESYFRFPFFSSSPSNSSSSTDQSSDNKSESPPPEETNKSGFDPESLERAANAIRGINKSPHAKKVFDFLEFNNLHIFVII
jgi:ATPase family AAA domain-containing protein 3A/B